MGLLPTCKTAIMLVAGRSVFLRRLRLPRSVSLSPPTGQNADLNTILGDPLWVHSLPLSSYARLHANPVSEYIDIHSNLDITPLPGAPVPETNNKTACPLFPPAENAARAAPGVGKKMGHTKRTRRQTDKTPHR